MEDAAALYGDNIGKPVPILSPVVIPPLQAITYEAGGPIVATSLLFEVRNDEGVSHGHLFIERTPAAVQATLDEARAKGATLVIWAVRMAERHPLTGRAWLMGDVALLSG